MGGRDAEGRMRRTVDEEGSQSGGASAPVMREGWSQPQPRRVREDGMAKARKRSRRRRGNLLPDEYKRRGLVAVEMGEIEAMLFAPAKLKAIQDQEPGYLLKPRSAVVEEHYIVTVRRHDGTWEYTIQHDGEVSKIPGKVVDRMLSYRQAIIKEQRRDQATARHRRTVQQDQDDAEAQPEDELSARRIVGIIPGGAA